MVLYFFAFLGVSLLYSTLAMVCLPNQHLQDFCIENFTNLTDCFTFQTSVCPDTSTAASTSLHEERLGVTFGLSLGVLSINLETENKDDYQVIVSSRINNLLNCSAYTFSNVILPMIELECFWTNESQNFHISVSQGARFQSFDAFVPHLFTTPAGCPWKPEILVPVSPGTNDVHVSFAPPDPQHLAPDGFVVSLVQRRASVYSRFLPFVPSNRSEMMLTTIFEDIEGGDYSVTLQPQGNFTTCLVLATVPIPVSTPKRSHRIPIGSIVGVLVLAFILATLFVLTWLLLRLFGQQTVKSKPIVLLVYHPESEEYSQIVSRFANYLRSHCYMDVVLEMWGPNINRRDSKGSTLKEGDSNAEVKESGMKEEEFKEIDLKEVEPRKSIDIKGSDFVIAILSPGMNPLYPEWLTQDRVVLTTFEHVNPPPTFSPPTKPVLILLDELPRLLSAVHNCQPMFSWLKVYPKMPGYDFLSNTDGYSLHHAINKLSKKSAAVMKQQAKKPEEIPLVTTQSGEQPILSA